jgi:predicted metalloprotease
MIKQLPRKQASAQDLEFHRQCQVACLQGIYASYGAVILEHEGDADFEKAIRAARRVARKKADEMLRADS